MIPFSTTLITVNRPEDPSGPAGDPYDEYDATPPTLTTIVSGVRAVISFPSASVELVGGDRVAYSATVTADPCDMQPADQITDTGGTTWEVLWARLVTGIGLDHIEGELRLTSGVT